jgi:low temperature requirement protein LtrA
MTSPAQSVQRDAVSPLELFFDLVFVFAVSQLSHHLLDHLSWRGAAETLVLLIAVFGIWSGTSFEATLLHIARSQARWLLLAVMLVGLFMNAAMLERCRLFLLIALGESVLSSGTALADASRTLMTVVAGTCALVTIVALWALHCAASVASWTAMSTPPPIRSWPLEER